MAYRDPAVRRQRDRERFRKRTAERVAQGLCPRCGDGPPAPERSVCDPCAEKRNRASRARDARLRAEGKPRRDPDKARTSECKRSRREKAKRIARGLCTRCGKAPAAPDRASCEPCLQKRREADRASYAAGKATGKLYGGANPDAKRRSARAPKQEAPAGAPRGRTVHPLRPVSARRGRNDLRTVPRQAPGGGTATVCRTSRRRSLRPLRRAGLRRPVALRPLHRHRRGRPVARTQEHAEPQALRRAPRPRPVHVVRSAVPGRVTLRPVRGTVLPWLGPFPGHPGLGPELHRDRDRDGPGARPVRLRGRRVALPSLREARPGPGRGALRLLAHGLVHGLDLTGRRRGGGLAAAQPARRSPPFATVRCERALRHRPASVLPDYPAYCFCPFSDGDGGSPPICIVVEGLAFGIPTALVRLRWPNSPNSTAAGSPVGNHPLPCHRNVLAKAAGWALARLAADMSCSMRVRAGSWQICLVKSSKTKARRHESAPTRKRRGREMGRTTRTF